MARQPRNVIGGLPQHVVQRGNNRQRIFACDADRARYLSYLAAAIETDSCAIHAYVLMSNHVHLLVTPADDSGVSRLMKRVGQRYVSYFNRRYGRSGTLWEGRFRAGLVDSERYLIACMRYIESNPVRAGIVGDAEAYRWSSFRHNALGHRDELVSAHPVYLAMNECDALRQARYRELFAAAAAHDDEHLIRSATHRGDAIGDDTFRQIAATELGRPVCRQVHGGDRRSDRFRS